MRHSAPPELVLAGRYFYGRSNGPHMNCQDILTVEPGKRGGKPCIRRMRITVYDVLSYLAAGMPPAEVLADFPYLTAEDIQACLAYAAERDQQTLLVA